MSETPKLDTHEDAEKLRRETEDALWVGDVVQIKKDLPDFMDHFPRNCEAVVLERNRTRYTLHLKGHGFCAWYDRSNLTLLEKNKPERVVQWKEENAQFDGDVFGPNMRQQFEAVLKAFQV